MTSKEQRLRKYRRKKNNSFRTHNPRLERYLTLYWRYHGKVYGPFESLWGEVIPTGKPPK